MRIPQAPGARGAERLLLDALLALCKERGWLKARQRQRPDSTPVLAKIRAINRHMCVGEAMRFALNNLAVVAPDWLSMRFHDVRRFDDCKIALKRQKVRAITF